MHPDNTDIILYSSPEGQVTLVRYLNDYDNETGLNNATYFIAPSPWLMAH